MKIIVHDASVLIDLSECDILDLWFSLGYKTLTTSLILHEVNRKNQKSKLQRFVDNGSLIVESIGATAMTQLVFLHAELSPRNSLEDTSALFIASSQGAILLTGDNDLRKRAESRGIEVHGLLWVFDMLVSRGAILADVAADRLEKLIASETCRLPKQECRQRIKKWRGR